MTYTPIPKGTEDWDVPLNAALTNIDGRLTTTEGTVASQGALISGNTASINSINTSISRLEWRPDDYNWISWSFDPAIIQNSITSVSGTIYMTAMIVRVQTTLTNIITNIATAGSGLTAGQNLAAIYDSTGTQLRITSDQSSSWNSIGLKVMPFTGGSVVLTPGKYWVAFMSNGTTPAQPWSSSSTAVIGGVGPASSLNNANARFMTGPTGQTALPASISIGTLASIGQTRWFALS